MKKQQAGFTLIELLLTLGVLAIGLTSIFALLPGVTDFSRNLRDEDRMQTFAEAVFASVEWTLSRSETPDLVSDKDKLSFQTILGNQTLIVGSTEQPWPDTEGVADLVPVFYYTLQLQTTAVDEVEVRLEVRPQSRNERELFTRVLYPQVKAW